MLSDLLHSLHMDAFGSDFLRSICPSGRMRCWFLVPYVHLSSTSFSWVPPGIFATKHTNRICHVLTCPPEGSASLSTWTLARPGGGSGHVFRGEAYPFAPGRGGAPLHPPSVLDTCPEEGTRHRICDRSETRVHIDGPVRQHQAGAKVRGQLPGRRSPAELASQRRCTARWWTWRTTQLLHQRTDGSTDVHGSQQTQSCTRCGRQKVETTCQGHVACPMKCIKTPAKMQPVICDRLVLGRQLDHPVLDNRTARETTYHVTAMPLRLAGHKPAHLGHPAAWSTDQRFVWNLR